METKTITIKSVERTSGTKKDNTEWHRISIKATDGKWYSSFSPLNEDALKEGTELKVQVIQSKISNTFEIKKLLEYANPARQGAGEGNRLPTGSENVAPLSAQIEQADSLVYRDSDYLFKLHFLYVCAVISLYVCIVLF